MCSDTGVPRWFVKLGNDAAIEGGMIALEAALGQATASATKRVRLRPNRMHPLWWTTQNTKVGIAAPKFEYDAEPTGVTIDLITVHKGGLFGTEYRKLFSSDGIRGIEHFYLDSLMAFGKRGLACQPAIIGIGLGASKDTCMALGKRAVILRVAQSRNSDPKVATIEPEFQRAWQFHWCGRCAVCRQEHGHRLQYRSRLLPHARAANVGACILSVIAPCHGAQSR